MNKTILISKLLFLALIVSVFYGIFEESKHQRDIILENKTQKQKIHSIEFTNSTKGFFILGIGSFDGYEYYSYYVIRKDGGLMKVKTDVEEAVIYEDSEKPYIIEKGRIYLIRADGKIVNRYFERNTLLKAEIHVPKGTIIKKIKL